MFNIGISYGATVCNIDNIFELQNWDAKVLEIPLSYMCNELVEKIKKYDYSFSLHIPSFELINKYGFIKNFTTKEEVLLYIDEIKKILLSIQEKPEYLVAHYPLRMITDDVDLIKSLNGDYIIKIHELAKKMNLNLYIENVVVNRHYYLPEIYKDILNYCDGICFDIGHFHTVQALLLNQNVANDYVSDFFDLYQENIKCIHLYNSTNKLNGHYDYNIHYPFSEYPIEEGFMDTGYITNRILALDNVEYIIHEIHRTEFDSKKNYNFDLFGKYDIKEV